MALLVMAGGWKESNVRWAVGGGSAREVRECMCVFMTETNKKIRRHFSGTHGPE